MSNIEADGYASLGYLPRHLSISLIPIVEGEGSAAKTGSGSDCPADTLLFWSPLQSCGRNMVGAKHRKGKTGRKSKTITRSPNEEWFESTGLRDVAMMAESAIEGPPAKRHKKDEEPKSVFKYPTTREFFATL